MDEVAEAVFGLQHLMRGNTYRSLFIDRLGRPEDLSVLRVLRAVQRSTGEPPSVGSVASYLGVGVSTASRLVDRCVAAGLVVRDQADDDRRRSRLVLTREGDALLAEATTAHEELFRQATAGWEHDELDCLTSLIRRLTSDLAELSPR